MSTKGIFRILVTCLVFAACTDHSHQDHSQHRQKDTSGQMQNMPGMENMPGMDQNQPSAIDHSQMIVLTAREQLLAGITTQPVQPADFQQSVTALGIVAVDENTLSVIAAKVGGRIDKLYVRNPGEDVHPAQPLYDLYSETLLAEEQDLVQLVQNNASPGFIAAAKQKL